jgi:hypothetical protein
MLFDGNIFLYSLALARMLEHTAFFLPYSGLWAMITQYCVGLVSDYCSLNPLVAADPWDIQNPFVLSTVFQCLR